MVPSIFLYINSAGKAGFSDLATTKTWVMFKLFRESLFSAAPTEPK
jgi:hypothetical protein